MLFEDIKDNFPILDQQINGEKIVYLDNAATTQKPKNVINSLINYYSKNNSYSQDHLPPPNKKMHCF